MIAGSTARVGPVALDDGNELLTVSEATRRSGISKNSLYQYASRPGLPQPVTTNPLRWRAGDVDAYARSREYVPKPSRPPKRRDDDVVATKVEFPRWWSISELAEEAGITPGDLIRAGLAGKAPQPMDWGRGPGIENRPATDYLREVRGEKPSWYGKPKGRRS